MTSKYKQIEDHFIDLINTDALKIGDQLPSEASVTTETGFSRMTVNKALNHLERQGYITRVAGRGSFVRSKSMTRMLTERVGISAYLRSKGLKPESQLLSYNLLDLTKEPDRRKSLDLDSISIVHHFTRLRSGDGTPFAITEDFLSATEIHDLDLDMLNHSLYEYLDRLKVGVIPNYVEIKALKATKEQKSLLQLDDDFVLKTIESLDTVSKSEGRHRLGLFTSFYNSKMFTYRFTYPDKD